MAAACAGSLVLAASQDADDVPLGLIGGVAHTAYMEARGGEKDDTPEPDEDGILDIPDDVWNALTEEEQADILREFEVVAE
jgi:hypothetical protein